MSGFYVDVDEMLNMINKVVYEELARAPLPDVREEKHAQWKPLKVHYMCTNCYAVANDKTNYCAECGAKMDGGEHNETRTDL